MEQTEEAVIDGNDILANRSCSVGQVIDLAIARAREMGRLVRFKFMNVTITVAADSNSGLICNTYLFAPRNGIREIGPYPARVEEFDETKATAYVLHDHGRPQEHLGVLAYQLDKPAWGQTRSINLPAGGFTSWFGLTGSWYVKVVETGETFLLRGEDDPWGDKFRVCTCSTPS